MNTLSEQNLLICRRLSLWEHLDKCTGYVENRNKQEDQFDRSKTTRNQGRQSLRCPGALEATVRILGVSGTRLERALEATVRILGVSGTRLERALKATVRILGVSFLFLEGLVLYFKKTFINFQHQNSYTIGFFFFSPVGPQRDHIKGENILSQLSCRMHTYQTSRKPHQKRGIG